MDDTMTTNQSRISATPRRRWAAGEWAPLMLAFGLGAGATHVWHDSKGVPQRAAQNPAATQNMPGRDIDAGARRSIMPSSRHAVGLSLAGYGEATFPEDLLRTDLRTRIEMAVRGDPLAALRWFSSDDPEARRLRFGHPQARVDLLSEFVARLPSAAIPEALDIAAKANDGAMLTEILDAATRGSTPMMERAAALRGLHEMGLGEALTQEVAAGLVQRWAASDVVSAQAVVASLPPEWTGRDHLAIAVAEGLTGDLNAALGWIGSQVSEVSREHAIRHVVSIAMERDPDEVARGIRALPPSPDRDAVIEAALPRWFEIDQETAAELVALTSAPERRLALTEALERRVGTVL